MKRYTVHYNGSVQGVGFRFTTLELAQNFPVAGYVQNLPDGRVRIVAEGDQAELDRFLNTVKERMGRYIEEYNIEESEAVGEWGPPQAPNNFTIKH